ncbi:hypothetical protein ACFY93_24515 [Streptomyces sp. NPDC008313]|uniref:hypothetical protein n=1 Tax=Streptomyces sp. NPDC008313 TaxID=3364826 RepID=UPI0036EFA750
MLALRLARGAHPLVQFRRLLVTAASAGTGFLLLCTLGYAMAHPGAPAGSVLRLTWCLAPAAATVYFAVAVARTDPGTRPRPGLSAIGLGPARLMAYSAVTTALSCGLGSLLALLLFLHLRGDLTGMPFDGAASGLLAAGRPLPLPGILTLLALVPLAASLASAVVLRPRPGSGPYGGGRSGEPEQTEGTRPGEAGDALGDQGHYPSPGHPDAVRSAQHPAPPLPTPGGLPWGVALLAAGLAIETYGSRSGPAPGLALPGGLTGGPAAVLAGWLLTAVGLALAGPGITHLCGWLLQAVRPGALRLLAGRGLQEEGRRVGRPLGVMCAVASGAYALATLYAGVRPSFGPLTTLGGVLVVGCAAATLATSAVEARQARAATTAALLRLGAAPRALRSAAALRVGALAAVFGPLTWGVAELAAIPLTG